MKLSAHGVQAIIGFEGKLKLLPDGRYEAYRCPAGVWTIYAGVTEGVHEGMIVTESEGEAMFTKELAKFEGAVNSLVKVPLSQNQFDALVSFAYNVGSGALERSTLLKKLNSGDYDSVPSELSRWKMGGGRVLPGLVKRRAAEGAMWRSDGSPLVSIIDAMPQKVSVGGAMTQMNPNAGLNVSTTTTATNLVSIVMGVLIFAIDMVGGSGFLTSLAGIAGAVATGAAIVNQLHLQSLANLNTLIGSVGDIAKEIHDDIEKSK